MTYRADKLPPPPKTDNYQERYRWYYRIFEVINGVVTLLASGIETTPRTNITATDLDSALGQIDLLIPDVNEHAALPGTSGTPGAGNKYVTDADPRNTNSRTPTAHATTHVSTGSDPIANAVSGGASGLMTGTDKAAHDAHLVNTSNPHSTSDANLVTTDITTGDASTTKHGFAPKATAPAAGLMSVLGTENGETVRADKALFDATVPSTQAFGDAAATGSAMVAARRDHKHAMPAAEKDTTAVTGVLKGDGSAISAASAGTDYTSPSSTETMTNKRITKRTGNVASSATPTINTDNVDMFLITAQVEDITSMTTNLSGTATEGQWLWIAITGTAARAITWGTSFESSTVTLPATTVLTDRLDVGLVWNTVTSKWRCMTVA